ncbi:MAG TPA: hypothetical protein DGT21_11170 [Armatimonadetes bacterium]|jgi:predicted transcriptional regulator YdeE|nr:hypothetical protein [Armatimonadota bacterium]
MEPTIAAREAFTVMGVQVRCTPATADFHDIWENQYMPRDAEVKACSIDGAYYGVCFCTGNEGAVDYLAGMAVADRTTTPEGLVVRVVPAATEAVFECTLATISQTYSFIHGQWLPASQYELDEAAPDYEHYPPATPSGEQPVFIHIPVKAKA